MKHREQLAASRISASRPVSRWDLVALPLVIGLLCLCGWGSEHLAGPFHVGETIPISLDPSHLPFYTLETVLRMAIALVASTLFTLVYAALAAKSKAAERLLVPVLDILQSVPILGFLSATVTAFIALFPGSLLGPQCAAIFAIFTSQAWNMTFSLYQSLKTVPHDLREAADMYHLNSWQRFWRLELPFAMPGLLWNIMMSVSGGWFFVVASEAITVSGKEVMLPGVGSYIAVAINEKNMGAIGYAILAMLIVILLYDQLFFRPLITWADRFRLDANPGEQTPHSWVYNLFSRSRFFWRIVDFPNWVWERVSASRSSREWKPRKPLPEWTGKLGVVADKLWSLLLIAGSIAAAVQIVRYVDSTVKWEEVGWVFLLGIPTSIRVIVLIALSSLVWVPIGIMIGLRPRVAQIVQPIAQFLAAFPANLLYPVVVIAIIKYDLNKEIWTSPLMVLGTQWYILFNVIAGASTLPRELLDAAGNLRVRGWLWWWNVALPGVFPAYVTGALTAAGGCWNASIVSEVVSWGSETITAVGLGAYIATSTSDGDFHRVVLGVSVMCVYVMLFNRFFWRRLHLIAEKRLHLE